MSILGFSDAKITVLKRGPEEVREQGFLAEHIGSNVCPEVYRFQDDGYEMELLSPPTYRSYPAMLGVFGKLTTQVWPRKPYRDWKYDWLLPLKKWCTKNDFEHFLPMIDTVYPEEPKDGYCLIHGDPTMANIMMRNDGTTIVTDPMPRLYYRKEIPNRMEVDLGKLLQSAMGWERMLGCESSMWEQPDDVLNMLPVHLVPKTLLWGAIHLARVSRRAPSKGRHKIASWAKSTANQLARMII